MPETHDPVITISLFDPVAGYAVQSWEFDGVSLIRIGRAATNDVVLSDTTVSRMHGELTRTDAGWSVTALGRNGIVVAGRAITGATPVSHETVLRLAVGGPYLEFRFGRRRNTLRREAQRRTAVGGGTGARGRAATCRPDRCHRSRFSQTPRAAEAGKLIHSFAPGGALIRQSQAHCEFLEEATT